MPGDRRREEGLAQLRQGLALERANRIAEAVEAYRRAISSYPALREAHNALGLYYQRSGLMAKAAEEFRTVVSLDGDFLAFFNLGYVLVELERYEDALDAFEQCLSLEPDDSATHYEIGMIHLYRGDFGKALRYLQQPLRVYPEDWEVQNLIGRCYMGLRRYDEAMQAFHQALRHTQSLTTQVEILDSINTLQRHREFRQLNTVKDQIYAQDGVVYLGSAQDDGLHVSEVGDYHFTYPDIGTTLQRLTALIASYGWRFSAVVAADTMARPLALALAESLDIPLREPEQLTQADQALLVFAVAREAELLLLTMERLPCSLSAFCLGLNWLRHHRILPDIVGIIARGACSAPWEASLRRLRADGAPAEAVAAAVASAAEAIQRAITDTPPDTNLPRQIRYYTRTHRRLSVQ